MLRFERLFADRRITYALAATLLLLWSLLGTGWLSGASPLLALGSALIAFLTPGYVLSLWLLRGRAISLLERIPFALALSVGLLAVPAIVLMRNLPLFNTIALLLAGGFLIAGVAMARREGGRDHHPLEPMVQAGLTVLMLAAAWITALAPRDFDDWIYLGWITRLLHAPEMLWADTRYELSAGFVYQAYLSHLSGLDPVYVVQIALPSLLAAVGVLSFYGLCVELCGSQRLALWATVAQMALYVTDIYPTLGIGHVYFVRIGQDKVAAAFVLLPVAFRIVMWIENDLTRRGLFALSVVLLGLLATNVTGPALFAFIAGPFLILRILLSLPKRMVGTWRRFLPLIPLLILIPLAWWLRSAVAPHRLWFSLEGLTADQVRQFSGERLFFLSDRLYILHPSLITHPLKILAILYLPYLVIRARGRPAYQFLVVSFLVPLAVLYNPWVMAVFGPIVGGPYYEWRFLWFLPVGPVLLIVGHRFYVWLRDQVLRNERCRRALSPLAVGLLLTMLWLAVFHGHLALSRSILALEDNRLSHVGGSQFIACAQQWIETGDLVLAPRYINRFLFGTMPGARIFHFLQIDRVTDGLAAINRFYPDDTLQQPPSILYQDRMDLLDQYGVRFVIVEAGSQLDFEMQQMAQRFRLRCEGSPRQWSILEVLSATEDDPLAVGNTALAEGRWEDAVETYQTAVDSGYGDGQAWLAMGWAFQEQGALERAEEAYVQATRASPDQVWPWLYLGKFLVDYRSGEGAQLAFKSAIAAFSTLPAAHLALADLLLDSGQSELADESLRAAARLTLSDQAWIDHRQELLNLARIYEERQMWQQAEQAYRAVLPIADTAGVHRALGSIAMQQGEFVAAEREYRRAVRLNVWDPLPRVDLGWLYEEEERWEEAAREYRLALVLNTWNTTAQMRLARTADAQERYDEAEEAYRLAITKMAQVEPDSVSAHLALGWLLTRQEKREESIEVYRQALAIAPQNPVLWLRLGRNQKAAGYLADAVVSLQEALRLEPENTGAALALRVACREASDLGLTEVLVDCYPFLAEQNETRAASPTVEILPTAVK